MAGNWPELETVRGKFLFVLDENEEKKSADTWAKSLN
ncbi:hypothetical protein [Algoriphagus boritolerans]